MTYSVWNADTKTWSYYEAESRQPAPAGGKSRHPDLGVAPEDASPRLPAGAKLVGGGAEPVGTIAEKGFDTKSALKWAVIALAVYGTWRLLRS